MDNVLPKPIKRTMKLKNIQRQRVSTAHFQPWNSNTPIMRSNAQRGRNHVNFVRKLFLLWIRTTTFSFVAPKLTSVQNVKIGSKWWINKIIFRKICAKRQFRGSKKKNSSSRRKNWQNFRKNGKRTFRGNWNSRRNKNWKNKRGRGREHREMPSMRRCTVSMTSASLIMCQWLNLQSPRNQKIPWDKLHL